MSDRSRLQVDCPCCEAQLAIDRETGAVISHTAAEAPVAGGADFEDLLADLDRQKARAEQLFEQEKAAMADRDRVLDERFAEALRKAEEEPDDAPPPRPFDLD
ncbi:MAG: 2-nitropropane dioxygenase [Acidobacteriota bacterium]